MKVKTQQIQPVEQFAYLQTITPELAAEWLQKNNPNNRNIRTRLVVSLAEAMKRGTFVVNGDCIRFDDQGMLLDGQHRLSACIRAGVAFQTLVITGLDRNVLPTIDRNTTRSAGDTLRMLHGVTDYNVTAGVITMLLNLRMPDVFTSSVNSGSPTSQDIEQFYTDHKEQLIRVPSVTAKCKHLAQPSIVGSCYVLFYKQNPVIAEEFFEKLAHGENLDRTNPVYTLRDRLMREKAMKNRRLERADMMVLFLKTWINFRTGRGMQVLSWNREKETFAMIWQRTGLVAV